MTDEHLEYAMELSYEIKKTKAIISALNRVSDKDDTINRIVIGFECNETIDIPVGLFEETAKSLLDKLSKKLTELEEEFSEL